MHDLRVAFHQPVKPSGFTAGAVTPLGTTGVAPGVSRTRISPVEAPRHE